MIANKAGGLDSLEKGESAKVESLLACGAMRRRLMDLGLISGTRVKCVEVGAKGQISAYDIRGAVIALRCEDAGLVEIST